MAAKITKRQLKNNFNSGTLLIKNLGHYYEMVVQYRGYYVKSGQTKWAGPWRQDQNAAVADTFPYAQQGYDTGIQFRQS
jgi:hypothetical protein